jgi:hypothetical protein
MSEYPTGEKPDENRHTDDSGTRQRSEAIKDELADQDHPEPLPGARDSDEGTESETGRQQEPSG